MNKIMAVTLFSFLLFFGCWGVTHGEPVGGLLLYIAGTFKDTASFIVIGDEEE